MKKLYDPSTVEGGRRTSGRRSERPCLNVSIRAMHHVLGVPGPRDMYRDFTRDAHLTNFFHMPMHMPSTCPLCMARHSWPCKLCKTSIDAIDGSMTRCRLMADG